MVLYPPDWTNIGFYFIFLTVNPFCHSTLIEHGLYPCYLTQAVTRRLFIDCIRTHAHDRQVTSPYAIASQHIHRLLEAYFKIKSQWRARRRIIV